MTDAKTLLTTAELAARLNVCEDTVRAMVRDGRIPALRLGVNTLRFDWEEVTKALRAK